MCPVLLLDVSTQASFQDLSSVCCPRGSRESGRHIRVHSVVRGVVILGAAEEEGDGGEASFCDVKYSGSHVL